MSGLAYDRLSVEELERQAKEAAIAQRAAMLRFARVDGAAFAAYVLRDEETGRPIELADMHVEWHELIDAHDRILIWSHVEAGKTQQISVARTLFELGRDNSKRIVVLSKTQGQAIKVVRSVQSYIERSEALREVFPDLYPSIPWTSTALMVQREVFSKDFSLQACGVGGAIVGARIDILIVDDILDWQNTRTPAQRAELLRWFRSEFVGRMTTAGRVIVVGNAYHPEDFLHTLAREGYTNRTYPVMLPNGQPRFPKRWTRRRIAAKRIELGPVEAARQLDCVARKDSDTRCKEEWIRACLARGVGSPLLASCPDELFAAGWQAFTGVDLGVGKTKKSGLTVLFTILASPEGDRRVIAVESGRWGAREIVRRVLSAWARYRSTVLVEDNGAQAYLLEFAQEEAEALGVAAEISSLAILPFHTGALKQHPTLGVEGVFAEFAASKWIIPSKPDPLRHGHYTVPTETISAWISECENYDPARHTGDHLMASWFAREGARTWTYKPKKDGGGNATIVGADPTTIAPERRAVLDGWEAALRRS